MSDRYCCSCKLVRALAGWRRCCGGTESFLVRDSAKVRHALERLRQLGCRIALDDFGTGYSSLAYITRFPPDRLKIDKAFVRNVDASASDAAIANAILSLAKTLGIVVTAEGIERPSQLEWLRGAAADRTLKNHSVSI